MSVEHDGSNNSRGWLRTTMGSERLRARLNQCSQLSVSRGRGGFLTIAGYSHRNSHSQASHRSMWKEDSPGFLGSSEPVKQVSYGYLDCLDRKLHLPETQIPPSRC